MRLPTSYFCKTFQRIEDNIYCLLAEVLEDYIEVKPPAKSYPLYVL